MKIAEMLKAIKQYCKENTECKGCEIDYTCGKIFEGYRAPMDWVLDESETE